MLTVVPLTLTAARRHVHQHHSHLERPQGGLCAVGVADDGQLACVAILSLPRARLLNGKAAEVIRVASDGTRHAASMCLAAITRAGLALGYTRLVSSTLLGEAGTSYRAAGWRPVAIGGGAASGVAMAASETRRCSRVPRSDGRRGRRPRGRR